GAQDAHAGAIVDAGIVGDPEADQPDVADVVEQHHVAAVDARAVQQRPRPREGFQRDGPARGAAADGEEDLLAVLAAADQHRVPGLERHVERVLDGAKWVVNRPWPSVTSAVSDEVGRGQASVLQRLTAWDEPASSRTAGAARI